MANGKNEHFIKALKNKFNDDGYIVLPEVKNSTGYQKKVRYADAVVLQMWPSRGLSIVGYEFKRSRGDWLTELRNPAKADSIFKFCHEWYLLTENKNGVVKGQEEIPEFWGWQYLTPKGRIKTTKKAVKKEQPLIDYGFIFSLCRNVKRCESENIQKRLHESYVKGKNSVSNDLKKEKEFFDLERKKLDKKMNEVSILMQALGLKTWAGNEDLIKRISNFLNKDYFVLTRFRNEILRVIDILNLSKISIDKIMEMHDEIGK